MGGDGGGRGGLGGLGLSAAAHLLHRTQYALTLTSRSGTVPLESLAVYASLAKHEAARAPPDAFHLPIVSVDCAKPRDVLALFQTQHDRTIVGALHLAAASPTFCPLRKL